MRPKSDRAPRWISLLHSDFCPLTLSELAPGDRKSPAQHDVDRFGIGNVLLLENSRRQRVLIILIHYVHSFLDDDGSMVEFFIDKMHRATRDLYAVGKRLLLSFQTRESGQKGRMNI